MVQQTAPATPLIRSKRKSRNEVVSPPKRRSASTLEAHFEATVIEKPRDAYVGRGSKAWPLGSAAFTLLKENPRELVPLLGIGQQKLLYQELRSKVKDFRLRQVKLFAKGKCKPDIRASKPRNASRIHVTGAFQFVYFKLLYAKKGATLRYLKKKTTAAEVQRFAAWLISRDDENVAKISNGSALRYLDTLLTDVRIYEGVDLRKDVRLGEFMDDLDLNAKPTKAQKKALGLDVLLKMLRKLEDEPTRTRVLQSHATNDRLLAQVWGVASLLQFLGIFRFGEIGLGAATKLETERLLSWGTSLRLFRIKREYRHLSKEEIESRLNVTEDVDLENFPTEETDGFEVVFRAGVRSKGRRTRARRNVEKSISVWDSEKHGHFKLSNVLRKLFMMTKLAGAKEGTPISTYEGKNGKFVSLDNATYNEVMKALGREIGRPDWKSLSSKQWRIGGKSTATRRERLHLLNTARGRSTALGGWSTQIGNSPIYDQQPREFFAGMAERMLEDAIDPDAQGIAVRFWEETHASDAARASGSAPTICKIM